LPLLEVEVVASLPLDAASVDEGADMLEAEVVSASASVDDDSSFVEGDDVVLSDDESFSVVEGADVELVDEEVHSSSDELVVSVVVEPVLELPPSSGMQSSDQTRVNMLLVPIVQPVSHKHTSQ
jgi:hypothetical protein